MIYLDYAATTPPKYFAKNYGCWLNSNANYAYDEQRHLDRARERIKKCLKVQSGYVLFTRCATESIEWLSNHLSIRCPQHEHDSVYNVGYKNNHEKTLLCVQLVNQLSGMVFDISDNCQTMAADFYGSDYTAAIGHIDLPENPDKYLDAIWFSGHKFGAEKGIGGLWISDRLFDYLGGSQDPKNQYGFLHGTVNVAGAIAMAQAMADACFGVEKKVKNYKQLLLQFIHKLAEANIDHTVYDCQYRTPAINLICFPQANADALQTWLSSKGIYVSIAASACADSEDRYRVAYSFGLTQEEAEHSIRVSFGSETTVEDIDGLVDGIKEFYEKFVLTNN